MNFDKQIKNILGKGKKNSFSMPKNKMFNTTMPKNKMFNTTMPKNKMFNMNKFFGDKDKDGIKNIMDCNPFDKTKQGPLHKSKFVTLYHGTQKENVSNIQKSGLRGATLGGKPGISLTPNKKVALLHAEHGPEKIYGDLDITAKEFKKTEGTQPAILKITVPKDKVRKEDYDIDEYGDKEKKYWDDAAKGKVYEMSTSYIYPENIKEVDYNKFKNIVIRKNVSLPYTEDKDNDGIIAAADNDDNNPDNPRGS